MRETKIGRKVVEFEGYETRGRNAPRVIMTPRFWALWVECNGFVFVARLTREFQTAIAADVFSAVEVYHPQTEGCSEMFVRLLKLWEIDCATPMLLAALEQAGYRNSTTP